MEGLSMKRLTFERAVLIVFILIILISTSDITWKYIEGYLEKGYTPLTSDGQPRNVGFSTMLMTADDYFKEGNYESAAKEYLTMTLKNTLSHEQKAHAYFRLGVCQYNLKNYERAVDSFSGVITFSPNDSIAYNNAAVSAYNSKDMKKAIELQKRALEILPAVEYYYNLGRMYEDIEDYQTAADNYTMVAKGEHNISAVERIDPVRVKEKVARLKNNQKEYTNDIVNRFLIVYRLEDNREILTVNENEMNIKQGDFVVKVENQGDSKNIMAEYDIKKYDPYDLISELIWTVHKDGKVLYKNNSDKIKVNTKDTGNYEVKLNIKYNGNKEMLYAKNVRIKENQSTIDNWSKGEVVINTPTKNNTKTYIFSVYEQLFNNDFKISNAGNADKYSVVWGRDSGVETAINKKLAVDIPSSLVVKNTNDKNAGLWINLDSLLKSEDIKGKTINISFYAREITENADLYVNVRVKTNNMIVTTPDFFPLPFQFGQQSVKVYLPEDASGLTISIKTREGEEFNIDAFTITD